jgi:hypothetical protein
MGPRDFRRQRETDAQTLDVSIQRVLLLNEALEQAAQRLAVDSGSLVPNAEPTPILFRVCRLHHNVSGSGRELHRIVHEVTHGSPDERAVGQHRDRARLDDEIRSLVLGLLDISATIVPPFPRSTSSAR